MKNTRKLLMAALMLVVAFAAVVSSTYAWFTLSNPLVVEDINVSVSQSSGIYMAVKGGSEETPTYTWRTSLTEDMIRAGIDNKLVAKDTGKYTPVCATVTGQKLDLSSFKKLSSVAGNNGGALSAATAGTDYSTFTIYFKADQGATLDITSLVAAANSNLNAAGLSMLRVAVKGSTATEAQMWKKYQDNVSGIEVTKNPEIDANGAKVQYNSFYNVANPAFSTFVNAGILATSDNTTATIKLDGYTGYKAAHNEMCVNETTETATKLPTQIVTVPKYENESSIVSITFTIWLEGWDSLSTDALSGTNFSFNFVLGAHPQGN